MSSTINTDAGGNGADVELFKDYQTDAFQAALWKHAVIRDRNSPFLKKQRLALF